MDYKVIALVLVSVAAVVKVTEGLHPNFFVMHKVFQHSAQRFHEVAAARLRQKRSADPQQGEQNLEDYVRSGAADQPHQRQKRAVFSGNITIVAVLSGVACLLCVLAIIWSIYVLKFKNRT